MLDIYLSFLFVCTESLTLVSDPTSRRFIRWLLFQTFIYIYIYRERERERERERANNGSSVLKVKTDIITSITENPIGIVYAI